MKRVLLALALLGMTTGVAMADINDLSGGVFILHAPPGLAYSVDPPTGGWCGTVWQTTCENQVNTMPCSDDYEWVWYILSNFYETKNFKAVEYGIVYDPDLYLYAAGMLCTPSAALTIEYPATGDWPDAGSGISIALTGTPYWTGTMVTSGMVYGWHYCYLDPTSITLGPMPLSGSIGWLSPNLTTYPPACIGVLGIDLPGVACCSEAPPVPHACCLPDGRCVVLFAADCQAQGGIVYPDLTCDGVDCPQPPHACCLEDGHCVVLPTADCVAQGGTVYPDLTCDGVVCPQPPVEQACCLENGDCVLAFPDACVAQGGTVYPDLTCDGVVCPQPPVEQACCLENGDCVLAFPDACVAQGGTVYPDLTCDTVVCPMPEPHACCFEDGSCLDLLAQAECEGMGGVWYPDVTCETPGFTCPQPLAACCFDYDNDCYMMTEVACVSAGGTWYVGMDCLSFTCPFWAVCCVNQVCHITTEAGCTEIGGEFHSAWFSCDPNPCEITPVDPASWGAIKSIYR
jgi:hypothetical protein